MRLQTASQPCRDSARADRLVSRSVLAAAIVALGAVAVLLGSDGSGDLRNYHYYGGWALLNKPVGFDIAPAQLQTYIHPLLDSIYYRVLRWLNAYPRLITFFWAIPQALAVWAVYHVAHLSFAFMPSGRRTVAILAALIGGSGAAALSVAGTSMSEAIPDLALLGAVWLVLRADQAGRLGEILWRRYAGAGLLAGAAAALKLTTTPYLIAFGPAIVAMKLLEPRLPRWGGLLAFAAGVAASLAVIGGPWWLAVYRVFGNPLYPFYNAVFHSPYFPPVNIFDSRFLPQTALEWLTYPVEWAFKPSRRSSEPLVRDPRILFEMIAAAALLASSIVARLRGGTAAVARIGGLAWCAAFAIVAYALWLKTFSILRYAAALEMLSGVLVLGALALPLARLASRLVWPRLAVGLGIAAALIASLVLPTWERRRPYLDRVVSTDMPKLPADSTVLLVATSEGAFLAPFEPVSVRFIGRNNNLVAPHRTIGLERLISQAIDGATGPLWSISDPGQLTQAAGELLAMFGLRPTAECRPITSSIAPPMSLCRLERIAQSPPRS